MTRNRRSVFVVVFGLALGLVGCGGSGGAKTKGGGDKGAAAAKASNQKSGSNATSKMGSAQSQGSDSGGITCDGDLEGIAWCDSDTNIIFCSGGTWYLLDCEAFEAGAFCGVDLESAEVDCYVEVAEG